MPHGYEACKTCTNRYDLCKNTRIENCREKPQQDILRTYTEEKSAYEMFQDAVKRMAITSQ